MEWVRKMRSTSFILRFLRKKTDLAVELKALLSLPLAWSLPSNLLKRKAKRRSRRNLNSSKSQRNWLINWRILSRSMGSNLSSPYDYHLPRTKSSPPRIQMISVARPLTTSFPCSTSCLIGLRKPVLMRATQSGLPQQRSAKAWMGHLPTTSSE